MLLRILGEGTIRASNEGFVIGQLPVVCFQDAPLLGLAQNVLLENADRRPRYEGVGLGFNKFFAFSRGARPVVYEQYGVATSMLQKSEHWRIVTLDLSKPKAVVDWTHEREWRCPADFKFELRHCVVVIESVDSYRDFVAKAGVEMLGKIGGVSMLRHSMG